jgi:hypothetical protein
MDAELGRTTGPAAGTNRGTLARRLSTETKASFKTTEFFAYVVVLVGILLASFLVKTGQGGQRYPPRDGAADHSRPGVAVQERGSASQDLM